jgi:soluble lytic murein transglycosylase-like protein
LILLLPAGLLCRVGEAAAKQVYSYKDASGVIHLTDAPTDPRFRPFRVSGSLGRANLVGRRMDQAAVQRHIQTAARTHGLDPALIRAVIQTESAFDPNAVSLAGAKGLMQLMPVTAREMEVADVFDPAENIRGGSRYLRFLLNRYGGDLRRALAAYNIGPERVAFQGALPNVSETQQYVQQVLEHYRRFKNGQ